MRACAYREGEFAKVTAIGVYLDDDAVDWLAVKWKGKSAEELVDSIDFFRDIVTGTSMHAYISQLRGFGFS